MDKIFKALADINRRKMISLLRENEMSVNQILKNFDISQATVSNHLSILRKANLVTFAVKGKQRIYKLNIELLQVFVERLNKFSETNSSRFLKSDIGIRGIK